MVFLRFFVQICALARSGRECLDPMVEKLIYLVLVIVLCAPPYLWLRQIDAQEKERRSHLSEAERERLADEDWFNR
jgi:hypothetical protein